MIQEWFKELEHYGFIILVQHGCLGVEGKGKSPHWRLTELGMTSKASADGIFEPPTNEFMKWNGTAFKAREARWPKNKIPHPRGKQCAPAWEALVHPRGKQSNGEVHPRRQHKDAEKRTRVGNITS
jgi:hypothetical protein